MYTNRSERGQTLILIVIALVGIMGFAALAVDGGQIYAERRRAQNAADAAALAAAKAAALKKTDTQITSVVNNLTTTNGFTSDGAKTVVAYHHPPTSGPYDGNSEYYQVTITQQVKPIFSQLIFAGTEAVTVESVARVSDASAASGMNAMMSVHTATGENGIDILGDAAITIHGGNMWSNNNGEKKGNAGDIWVFASPDPSDTTLGNVITVGNWSNDRKMHANFVSGATPITYPDITQPYCPASNTTINGVNYYVWNGRPDSPMQPGIHCVHGNIILQGSNKDLEGTGVLLVLLDGGIQSKGGGFINITRANDIIDANGNQWGGMAIFAPISNHSEMDFGGNSTTLFNGTLFVPGMTCDIGGTPANENNHTAFICDNFKIHGNPDVRIIYQAEENYQLSPALELAQ